MQVSHVEDHVTHAMIGGLAPIDMGMDDSAEFFHMLSSVLYKNQPLAVARETICNAWDAHIEAGKQDLPIEITLNEEYLIIQDFGLGIHHDKMGKTYGVYGGSSKRAIATVTGGFGLGCKAPFSYTDNFEVTSCHEGTKTIYRLSKSSAKAMGKPAIVPIVSVPTTDSGLTVKIPIKNSADMYLFERLVKEVVFNGEILANLNGNPMRVLALANAPHGFVVFNDQKGKFREKIQVRLGNVIYPLPNHTVLDERAGIIKDKLGSLISGYHYNNKYVLVLMAEPNSVSVTPSREALSEQDHTLETLSKLLDKFINYISASHKQEWTEILEEHVQRVVQDEKFGALFQRHNSIPELGTGQMLAQIYESPEFTRQAACNNTIEHEDPRFYQALRSRVEALIATKPGNEKLLKSYLAEINRLEGGGYQAPKRSSYKNTHRSFNWLHRKVLWPLIRDLKAQANKTQLFVYTKKPYRSQWVMTEPSRLQRFPLDEQFKFMQNVAFLTHNMSDVANRSLYSEVFRKGHYDYENTLVFRVPRKASDVEEARKVIEAHGLTLIDLTKRLDKEPVPVVLPKAPTIKKRKGLVTLRAAFGQINGTTSLYSFKEEFENDTLEKTTTPKAILRTTKNLDFSSGFYTAHIQTLLKYWGNDVGLVFTQEAEDSWRKKGVPDARTFVMGKLLKEIKSNKELRSYLTTDRTRLEDLMGDTSRWLKLIQNDEILRKRFGLPEQVNRDQKALATLIHHILEYPLHFDANNVEKLKNFLDKHPVRAGLVNLAKKLDDKQNQMTTDYLAEWQIWHLFEKKITTAEEEKSKETLRKVISIILKD